MKRLKWDRAKVTSFKRGGKLQGLGANTSSRIVGGGGKGRRIRIPRAADSFKSRTDNT